MRKNRTRQLIAMAAMAAMLATAMPATNAGPLDKDLTYWETRQTAENTVPLPAGVLATLPGQGYEMADPCTKVGLFATSEWLEPIHYPALVIPAGHLAIAPVGATFSDATVQGGLLGIGDLMLTGFTTIDLTGIVATVDGDWGAPTNPYTFDQAAPGVIIQGAGILHGTISTGAGLEPERDEASTSGSHPDAQTYDGKDGIQGGSVQIEDWGTMDLTDLCVQTGDGSAGGLSGIMPVSFSGTSMVAHGGEGGKGGDFIANSPQPWVSFAKNALICLGDGGDGAPVFSYVGGKGSTDFYGGAGGCSGWIYSIPEPLLEFADVQPNMCATGGGGGDGATSHSLVIHPQSLADPQFVQALQQMGINPEDILDLIPMPGTEPPPASMSAASDPCGPLPDAEKDPVGYAIYGVCFTVNTGGELKGQGYEEGQAETDNASGCTPAKGGDGTSQSVPGSPSPEPEDIWRHETLIGFRVKDAKPGSDGTAAGPTPQAPLSRKATGGYGGDGILFGGRGQDAEAQNCDGNIGGDGGSGSAGGSSPGRLLQECSTFWFSATVENFSAESEMTRHQWGEETWDYVEVEAEKIHLEGDEAVYADKDGTLRLRNFEAAWEKSKQEPSTYTHDGHVVEKEESSGNREEYTTTFAHKVCNTSVNYYAKGGDGGAAGAVGPGSDGGASFAYGGNGGNGFIRGGDGGNSDTWAGNGSSSGLPGTPGAGADGCDSEAAGCKAGAPGAMAPDGVGGAAGAWESEGGQGGHTLTGSLGVPVPGVQSGNDGKATDNSHLIGPGPSLGAPEGRDGVPQHDPLFANTFRTPL